MATHVNASGRPNLAPLWTSSQSLGQRPPAAFRAAQAPLLSPSPISAATLPSPLYPSSFDRAIRKKDRVLLNSLSHKINPSNVSSPKSLASVEGPSPLVSKLEHASIELTKDEKSPSKSPEITQGSLGGVTERHDYRSWEDYSDIETADAYAIARSIRRNSNPAADSHPFWEEGSWEKKASHRLTLRAIVKPKAPGRQSFLIQRSLDIDELRANTSPSIGEKALLDASPLKGGRKPLPVPAKWLSNSKTQSTAIHPSQAGRAQRITSHSTDYDKLVHDPKTVPIHTHHIISSLPALATLLTSGHIQTGDIVYLPVPHAESWPQTVRYVYTGQGELTTAIRENIIYLGGRV